MKLGWLKDGAADLAVFILFLLVVAAGAWFLLSIDVAPDPNRFPGF